MLLHEYPYEYICGLKVGDRVKLVAGPRKYNTHIYLDVGMLGTVIEPSCELDDFPLDGVEVRLDDGGQGVLDSCILEFQGRREGQTYLS